MYTPPAFAVDDLQAQHDFMRQYSFATVVSADRSEPTASHLPLLLDSEAGEFGQLIGHMAKANTQWKTAANHRVLVIFNGPHAYITPSWYGEDNVVPTWNYTAVHVYGELKLVADPDRLTQIVTDYVETFESDMPRPWPIDRPDAAFIRQLIDAIVGFTIDIERIEGKWKLSQNHSQERRQRVIEGLRNRQHPGDVEVAGLMEKASADPDRPPL